MTPREPGEAASVPEGAIPFEREPESREQVLRRIYRELSADFEEGAIQRTLKSQTHKGYDTTGIAYQYVVNRFNDVLGLSSWEFDWVVQDVTKGTYASSGRPFFDICVAMTITITIHMPDTLSSEKAVRKCAGGHISATYSDALKGAITNALKKTAALFGVGKGAYEGTLDDDTYIPEEEETSGRKDAGKEGKDKGKEKEKKESKEEGGKKKAIEGQLTAIHARLTKKGIKAEEKHAYISKLIGREIKSTKELFFDEATKLIKDLSGDAPPEVKPAQAEGPVDEPPPW